MKTDLVAIGTLDAKRGLRAASSVEWRSDLKALEPSASRAVPRRRRQAPCAARVVALVARKEFADRLRSGWIIACVAVWLGAIGLTSLFGLVQIGHIGMQGYERTVVSLLNLVQYLVPLLGLLVGHDLIVSERDERTLPLLLASGAGRGRLLLGKFMGGCATLALPLLLGFAIAGAAIGLAARAAWGRF